jgi:hypothetical protein
MLWANSQASSRRTDRSGDLLIRVLIWCLPLTRFPPRTPLKEEEGKRREEEGGRGEGGARTLRYHQALNDCGGASDVFGALEESPVKNGFAELWRATGGGGGSVTCIRSS